jgi:hypothetical protein
MGYNESSFKVEVYSYEGLNLKIREISNKVLEKQERAKPKLVKGKK